MSDEMRDKLAEWLTDWLDNSAPYDTENEWDGADMGDALLAWLKTQPPVISDERAEALRREWAILEARYDNQERRAIPAFGERDSAQYIEARLLVRILGLLDVVEVKE